MADRYFIGTGNRNIADAANWSLTSGGAGGASVPTLADNAIFDPNSGTGTVTVNANFNCLNLTFTNIAALTISGSVFTLSVYGNLTLPATNLTWTFTGTSYLYLKATTSVNITMGAITGRSFNRLYFDGIGGTWTNQDEMTLGSGNILYIDNGNWNSNNYNISSTFVLTISSNNTAGTKTISLGSSILSNINWAIGDRAGIVLVSGTSTIKHVVVSEFKGGTQTYYDVEVICSGNALTSLTGSGSNYHNLSIIGTNLSLQGINVNITNITINGIFTVTGSNSTNYRLLIASNTIGTPRTITCNGTIVASNVDFRDITLAGTANRDLSSITGGSGDCGGNSGITFTPSQTQYHYRASAGNSNWSTSGVWFTGSGGTGAAGRVPLPQDDVIFDANSYPEGAGNDLYVNCPRIGRSLDMSGVDVALPVIIANHIECYGSYVLGENITPSGSFTVVILGYNNQDIDIKTFNKVVSSFIFYMQNAKATFKSNHNGTTIALGVSNSLILPGIVDFNDFNIKSNIGWTANNYEKGIFYFGNGIIEIPSDFRLHGNNILFAENSTVIFNPVNSSSNLGFSAPGKTFNKVQFSGLHTGYFDLTTSSIFAELIIDAGRKVRFTGGTTQTINKITAIGAGGNLITIDSITAAPHTLNITGGIQNVDYVNFKYCNVVQQNKLFAGVNSVNSGNNVNVVFGAIGAVSAAIPFTEIEILESTLLGQVGITSALTEAETFNGICQASAFLPVAFTEAESLIPVLIARVTMLPAFTEAETMAEANIIAWKFIEANFTEEEKMALLVFEKLTGPLVFSQIITGTLKFL